MRKIKEIVLFTNRVSICFVGDHGERDTRLEKFISKPVFEISRYDADAQDLARIFRDKPKITLAQWDSRISISLSVGEFFYLLGFGDLFEDLVKKEQKEED